AIHVPRLVEPPCEHMRGILPCSIVNEPMATQTDIRPAPAEELTLPVLGTTCASCVNRIERFLNRADGVAEASVNLATERATVRFDPSVIDRTGIVATIEAAGYDVGREAPAERSASEAEPAVDLERRAEAN